MILNVCKPKGWTSFDVVAKLRGALKPTKISHAGTLDPLAEGVLVILTDKDVKDQDKHMHQEKEYLAEIAFGIESPTFDMQGPLTFHPIPDLQKAVFAIIPEFIGTYNQITPAFSAKKVGGRRLYDIYRNGKFDPNDLPRKLVTVNYIRDVSLNDTMLDGHKILILKCLIGCESGTYIRSIAYEMGRKLNSHATLYSLTRTKIGKFKLEDSRTIEAILGDFRC